MTDRQTDNVARNSPDASRACSRSCRWWWWSAGVGSSAHASRMNTTLLPVARICAACSRDMNDGTIHSLDNVTRITILTTLYFNVFFRLYKVTAPSSIPSSQSTGFILRLVGEDRRIEDSSRRTVLGDNDSTDSPYSVFVVPHSVEGHTTSAFNEKLIKWIINLACNKIYYCK